MHVVADIVEVIAVVGAVVVSPVVDEEDVRDVVLTSLYLLIEVKLA